MKKKNTAQNKTVGIIGGKGIMGKFFTSIFRKHGFRVIISDISTPLSNKKLIQQSDIVMFSVPIDKTEKIIRELIPYSRPKQIWCDLTSLKSLPIEEMLKSKAEVMGMHPMFRPTQSGLSGQTVILCPARCSDRTKNVFKKIFATEGAKVTEMSAEKHDHLMSIIQVLLHFHTIVLGNTFRALNISLPETLQIASPIYTLEINLIGRLFSQQPELYASIATLNPESTKVITALQKEADKLAKIIKKKDLHSFEKLFVETADFLGSFKQKAMKETNEILNKRKKSVQKK